MHMLLLFALTSLLSLLFASSRLSFFVFFFFNDTATTEIYTLSLHDALPISGVRPKRFRWLGVAETNRAEQQLRAAARQQRSEEHTSELQSRLHLVCRLLLEKKKKKKQHKKAPGDQRSNE